MASRGVIYCAYGEPARRCLIDSVNRLRYHEPDLPVVVVSDSEIPGYKVRVRAAEDKGARSVKTQLFSLVPQDWEHILYLDADTVPQDKLTRFFTPLENGWELVMCLDEIATTVAQCRLKVRAETRATVKEFGTGDATQFAGGVFSWARTEQAKLFFQIWHREWRRWRFRDQGALVRAIAKVPLKMLVLSARVNAKELRDALEIWHRHGLARQRGAQ